MQDGFTRALQRVLVHEGGKVDDPRDVGGRTNQGVIQRTYDAWRKRNGLPARDVFLMTPVERDSIYRAQYWDAVRGHDLPPGLDYVVFDGAVNSGPRQSVIWLQRALGSLYAGKIDGVIGTVTLAAVDGHQNHDALVRDICDKRLAFLKALKTWPTFGKGWTARVVNVGATGQAWAMGDTGPAIQYVPGGEAKAPIEDAHDVPSTGIADVLTGAGGVQAVLAQAAEKLTPMAAGNEWIAQVVTALTVAGVAAFAGGALWRIWANRKADNLAEALA